MHAPKIAEIADAIGEPAELRLTRPPPRLEPGLVPFLWTGYIERSTVDRFLTAWTTLAFGSVDDDTKALAVRRLAEWRLVNAIPDRPAPEPVEAPYSDDEARVERALAVLRSLPSELSLVSNAVPIAPQPVARPEPQATPVRRLQPRAALGDAFRSAASLVPCPPQTVVEEPPPQPAFVLPAAVHAPVTPSPVAEVVAPRPVLPPPPALPQAIPAPKTGAMTMEPRRRLPRIIGLRELILGKVGVSFAAIVVAVVVIGVIPSGDVIVSPAEPQIVKIALNGDAPVAKARILLPALSTHRASRYRWWTGRALSEGNVKVIATNTKPTTVPGAKNDPTGVAQAVSVEGTRAMSDEGMRRRQAVELGAYVGASYAGSRARLDGDGVVITLPMGSAKIPKRVTVVDGIPIRTYLDLKGAIERKDPDSEHVFGFDDGSKARVMLPSDFRSVRDFGPLGVRVVSVNPRSEIETPVEIPNSDEATESAGGLAFALATYAALAKTDVAHGRTVLAAGEVLPDGSVLGVNYISTIGKEAADAGVDILIVPQSNMKAAGRYAEGVEVVGVTTVAEAIDFLNTLR